MTQYLSYPRVRYKAVGRTGAKGIVYISAEQSVEVQWDSESQESLFTGTDPLSSNKTFCAALLGWVLDTKNKRDAAWEDDEAGGKPDQWGESPEGISQENWDKARPTPETSDEKRSRLAKVAESSKKTLEKIAKIYGFGFSDDESNIRDTWCSGCLARGEHRQLNMPFGWGESWVCQNCGLLTCKCVVPSCENQAIRGIGRTGQRNGFPTICAEHSHEVPSFEHTHQRIDDLEHWEDVFEFRRIDVKKAGMRLAIGVTAIGAAVPMAVFAAPAIGGAVGVATGLQGAAATSHGLALLGGGAIANGGLGMAGGTLVIGAVGGGIGGAYGLRLGNAYLADDDSFEIECVRSGTGPVVLYSTGFLTERDTSWSAWRRLIDSAYPDSPVYRVHWGAKDLKALGEILGEGVAGGAMATVAWRTALHAMKKATMRMGPLGALSTAVGMPLNPWHRALARSRGAANIVAEIISRTDSEEGFVLIGHSLGAALMAGVIEQFAETDAQSPILEAHLLGAAYPASVKPHDVGSGVVGTVFNYHSMKDDVLGVLYRAISAGTHAAGRVGFQVSSQDELFNIDVSDSVSAHREYVENINLSRSRDQ